MRFLVMIAIVIFTVALISWRLAILTILFLPIAYYRDQHTVEAPKKRISSRRPARRIPKRVRRWK